MHRTLILSILSIAAAVVLVAFIGYAVTALSGSTNPLAALTQALGGSK